MFLQVLMLMIWIIIIILQNFICAKAVGKVFSLSRPLSVTWRNNLVSYAILWLLEFLHFISDVNWKYERLEVIQIEKIYVSDFPE